MPSGTRTSHVSQLTPHVSLEAIGQALADVYDNLVAEGVPEHLAALVRQVEARDRTRTRLALVVEDDANVRALAETLLEETELAVAGCESAEAALAVLQARGHEISLVFADVRLAGDMDGVQLAAAVATLWPTTRLVLTSGTPQAELAPLPEGVVFIPKPWRALDLLCEAERATQEPRPAVA
jgi:CheY-like chemotaxis protein